MMLHHRNFQIRLFFQQVSVLITHPSTLKPVVHKDPFTRSWLLQPAKCSAPLAAEMILESLPV